MKKILWDRIRSWQPVDPPGVKKAMSNVVMGFPQVGHEQYPNLEYRYHQTLLSLFYQMGEGSFSQGSSRRDLIIGDPPAVGGFQKGGTNHPDRRPKSVMTHLHQGRQFWVDFERFEPEHELFSFGSWNLGANGERYISQSQKPQIAQAATMFLYEKKRRHLLE